MSQATTATLKEEWPFSDSPHKDPNTWLSTPLEDSQAPSARQSRGAHVYSDVDIERLSLFINRYARAWHVIRKALGPDEALRLTQLHTWFLEREIRRAPEQYFWQHRRWKTRPPEEWGG